MTWRHITWSLPLVLAFFTGLAMAADSCEVEGKSYTLGEPFSFDRECHRYKCMCNTDGSWNCPAKDTVNLCNGGDVIHRSSDRRYTSSSGGAGIHKGREVEGYCNVDGKRYSRGKEFTFDQDCYRFHCNCNDDGGWNCPAERTENICGGRETAARSSRTRSSSRITDGRRESRLNTRLEKTATVGGTTVDYCDVKGQRYPLGRPFTYDEDCYRYQCMCNDDGSWNCPGEDAEQYCDQMPVVNRQRTGSSSTRVTNVRYSSRTSSQGGKDDQAYCLVNGRRYIRGRPFSFDEDCYRFNCNCNEDGGWVCPSERTENICEDRDSRSRQTGSSSSRTILTRRYNVRTSYQGGKDDQAYCLVNGRRYIRGRPFSFDEDCYRFNCNCNEDGGWICPSERTENICEDRDSRSRQTGSSSSRTILTRRYNVRTSYQGGAEEEAYCIVNGVRYLRGRPFSFDEDCYRFNCNCNEDGGWICPSERTENICEDRDSRSRQTGSSSSRTIITRRYNVRTSYQGGAEEEAYCIVNGVRYLRGRPFSFDEDCYRFNCNCNEDGGWICPSERTENICEDRDSRSRQTGSSSSRTIITRRYNVRTSYQGGAEEEAYCIVNGVRYLRGRPFSFDEDCYRFNCNCNEDGGWICPSERTENICEDRDSRSRQTGSSSSRTIITRRYNIRRTYEGRPEEEAYCIVNGRRYLRGGSFSFDEGCVRYNCECNEDGSWRCPAQEADYICNDRDTQSTRTVVKTERRKSSSSRRIGSEDTSDAYLYCIVEGVKYRRGQPFSFEHGCYRFNCMCEEDGRWTCPAQDTDNLCGGQEKVSRQGHTIVRSSRVEIGSGRKQNTDGDSCVVERKSYPRGQPFSFDKDCFRFTCMCDSDGSWVCPAEDTENICDKESTNRRVSTERRTEGSSRNTERLITERRRTLERNIDRRTSTGSTKLDGTNAENICLVDGKTFPRGQPFSFDQGCYRFRCMCKKDGSWTCPALDTENLCGGSEQVSRSGQTIVTRRVIQSSHSFNLDDGSVVSDEGDICLVSGKAYQRGRRFVFDQDCYRFRCMCNRDGSWECPADETENICGGVEKVSRSGRTIITRSRVSTVDRNDRGTNLATSGFCQVQNKQYTRGQAFSFDDGCYRFRCSCFQDGSWTCPSRDTVNLCGGTEKISRSGKTSVSSTRVRSVATGTGNKRGLFCQVDGKSYVLGRPFSFDQECYRFRCICNLDGSWNCPAEQTENLCGGTQKISRSGKYSITSTAENGKRTTRIESSSSTSSQSKSTRVSTGTQTERSSGWNLERAPFCLVDSKEYQLNRDFSFDKGCYRYNCFCSEDGSWNCPAADTRNLCGRNDDRRGRSGKTYYRRTTHSSKTSNTNSKGIGWCQVNGQYYRLNSRFAYTRGCSKFNCICRGDGTFTCPSNQIEDTCKGNPKPRPQPRGCIVQGQTYQLNTRFSYTEDCIKYNCICRHNGTYDCPATNSENVCEGPEERLGYCQVKGQYYRKNSRFTYTEDCYKYNCVCRLDGSYDCPSANTQNICEKTRDKRVFCYVEGKYYRPNTRFTYTNDCYIYNCQCKPDGTHDCSPRQVSDNCDAPVERKGYCHVEGEYYKWDSSFSYTKGCRKFNCQCTAKGRVDCPKERTEMVCEITTPTPARCYVEGRYYQPNTRFTYTKACKMYVCNCGSDGRYECAAPSDDPRCAQTTPRPEFCSVEGKYYRVNTRFSYVKDCYKYNCVCRADTSFDCPSSSTENICTPTPTQQPESCEVAGQYYRLNSRFSYRRGCTKYNCVCGADGSYDCPASRTEDLCRVTTPDPLSVCRACEVDGRSIQSGRRFSYKQDCFRYDCDCRCDGTWNCPSERTTFLCEEVKKCQTCTVKGRTYPGDSDFTHREGCYELSCRCRCDGTWDCPPDQATNVCPTRPPTTPRPACRQCVVRGIAYNPNTQFSYYEGCYEYNCECDCSGKWECPAERTKNICPETCRDCFVQGQTYRTNTNFNLQRGCNAYDCSCLCNGTYSCPESSKRDICDSDFGGCERCSVQDMQFPPNKRFKFVEACFEYDCDCECDGSWHCPEGRTKTICKDPLPEDSSVSRPDLCGTCKIGLNTYEGNTRFKHSQECFEFICDCNCDGSWDCDADQTKNLCEDGIPADTARLVDIETCRECDVYGVQFSSQRPFTYQRDCLERECFCHCDGTWTCPSEKNICGSGGRKGRLQLQNRLVSDAGCRVKGKLYKTRNFSFIEGCFEYNCVCNDGAYNCPSSKTKKVC